MSNPSKMVQVFVEEARFQDSIERDPVATAVLEQLPPHFSNEQIDELVPMFRLRAEKYARFADKLEAVRRSR